MEILRGTVLSEGLVAGEALVLSSGEVIIPDVVVKPSDREKEVARFRRAVDGTLKEINELTNATEGRLGDLTRMLGTYQSLLADESIINQVLEQIRTKRKSAATAVRQVIAGYVEDFRRMGGPLANYAPELEDLGRRLVARILGKELPSLDRLPRKVVIVADEITPMQALSIDRDKVIGFVTQSGSPESHTAILSRHLGIPAITGIENVASIVPQGASIIVDGLEGVVVLDPDKAMKQTYAMKIRRATRTRWQTTTISPEESVTQDGVRATIRCNVDTSDHVRELAAMGADGVGLFRTEFLYIGKAVPPDEKAQAKSYEETLKAFGSRPVIFRTMDFGADKFDARVDAVKEENPALGLRSIRLSFAREDLFRTQLRALLRASVHGNARIMFPMVTDAGEFLRAKAILEVVKSELKAERVPFAADVPVGVMIELPAAAIASAALMKVADFGSIGTNDLTQYTLAVDRTNGRVSDWYKPHHPAICRLIKVAVEAGLATGKEVSVCGEMAGSTRLVPVLMGLGVRSFSMAPPRMGQVVDRISRLTLPACRALADAVLASPDAEEALAVIDAFESRAVEERAPAPRKRRS